MTEPLSQRIVTFHGDELIGVQAEDGTVYAPFNRLCENLRLDRVGQMQRVQRHEVLRAALVTLMVETSGGPQMVQCLRIDVLPLWLAGIQASRVKDELLREKLIRYQKEAAQILWQAFKPQIIVDSDQALAPSTDADLAQLVQIAELGRAVTRMAEEQMEIRHRMDAAARAFKALRHDVTDVQVRLGVLEDQLHPAAYISDTQAAEVSNRVKALAELLTGQDASKNHYQGIFGELYRRFGVSSYKTIRLEQYAAVLAFLDDWRTSTGTVS